MGKLTIYTDGACSGNPGPGGWAAILIYDRTVTDEVTGLPAVVRREKELCGGEKSTTNNRMELLAVINGLEALNRSSEPEIRTDSRYIEQAINEGWIYAWKKKGWKRKEGELKNAELWQRLDRLLSTHRVTFTWVKGHAEDKYNERCDELAVREREKLARQDP